MPIIDPTTHGPGRYWKVGDLVATSDGRPGSGSVNGTIEHIGNILAGIRPDPYDGRASNVTKADENGLIWRYEHQIYARDSED